MMMSRSEIEFYLEDIVKFVDPLGLVSAPLPKVIVDTHIRTDGTIAHYSLSDNSITMGCLAGPITFIHEMRHWAQMHSCQMINLSGEVYWRGKFECMDNSPTLQAYYAPWEVDADAFAVAACINLRIYPRDLQILMSRFRTEKELLEIYEKSIKAEQKWANCDKYHQYRRMYHASGF